MSRIATLPVPLGGGADALRKWARQQLEAGVPRGILYLSILNSEIPTDFAEMLAWQELERTLGEIMVKRNLDGQAAERADDEDRAITLYEANVTDRFDGSHPYERLRILYAREHRYGDAIRICETYLEHIAVDPEICESYRKWIPKYRGASET
jgi:hypothetical protein